MTATPAELLLANWLGALAVETRDIVDAALAGGRRDADMAALLTLSEFPSTLVGDLATVLGLSPSATVRVVDRLCVDGLATRGPTAAGDARQVSLALTRKGIAEAERLQLSRLDALRGLVRPLDPAERKQLASLLDRMLRARPRARSVARNTCRYCIHSACRGPVCPVGSSVDAATPSRRHEDR